VKEIKSRPKGPLVKGKRTVASRLGWRNSGQRTLETLCTGFVKFVKRSSDSVTWNGVRVTASLGTRHSLKHRVSPRLRRVVFPRLRPSPSRLEVVYQPLGERRWRWSKSHSC